MSEAKNRRTSEATEVVKAMLYAADLIEARPWFRGGAAMRDKLRREAHYVEEQAEMTRRIVANTNQLQTDVRVAYDAAWEAGRPCPFCLQPTSKAPPFCEHVPEVCPLKRTRIADLEDRPNSVPPRETCDCGACAICQSMRTGSELVAELARERSTSATDAWREEGCPMFDDDDRPSDATAFRPGDVVRVLDGKHYELVSRDATGDWKIALPPPARLPEHHMTLVSRPERSTDYAPETLKAAEKLCRDGHDASLKAGAYDHAATYGHAGDALESLNYMLTQKRSDGTKKEGG